jgi:hypothetical protein
MRFQACIFISLIGSLCFPYISLAGSAAESMGTCMTDSMTGKERKQTAQWAFFSIAAHPEVKEFSKITADAQRNANEFFGKLVTRLITENCPVQTKKAMEEEGSEAMKEAFGLVGKVAMEELMTNNDVAASLSGFEKFLDKEKINAAFSKK